MMRILALFCFFAFAQGKEVVVLTDATFVQQTSSGVWFVEFYASWCGWCKRLEPTWNELASTVEGVNIGKIECIENPQTCQKLAIPGFPSLKVLSEGKMYAFNGANRDLPTLLEFAKGGYKSSSAESNPLAQDAKGSLLATESGHNETVLTQQNFFDRLSSGRWLIAAVAPWCGHCKALQPTLNELATVQDAPFSTGSINCDEDGALCRDLHVKSFPTLFVVDGDGFHLFDGNERSASALTAFATSGFKLAEKIPLPGAHQRNLLPRRGDLTLLDESSFDEATAEDAWLVGFSCGSNECKTMEAALAAVQKTHSLHLRVGVVDCSSKAGAPLCHEHAANAPSAVLFYKERGFLFEGEHTSDNYLIFVGEGFKTAASRNRLHLSLKRRLSVNTLNAAAFKDFAHQHRYLITICVAVFLLLWGVFIGSALSTRPNDVIEMMRRQAKLQEQQQANVDKKRR